MKGLNQSCCLAVLLALASGLALLDPVCAAEKTVRINLGTLAPRGSTYHQSLQAMAERWKQAPGGGARLVIYPDGTQGSETDMVRLMRVGSLHAGLLTAVGLAEIEQGVTGLQTLPMMFRSFDEFEFVNDKLRPMLEKRLAEKGFVLLFWVDAGWVRYFSKEPMLTPGDMKKRKVFVWAGNTAQVDIMKKHGYNPVPLETGDILPGLQTGLINMVPAPPLFARLGRKVIISQPDLLRIYEAMKCRSGSSATRSGPRTGTYAAQSEGKTFTRLRELTMKKRPTPSGSSAKGASSTVASLAQARRLRSKRLRSHT